MQTAVHPKLSIILPVHNAGVFLHKCIQSLLYQTLKDIEIIIVVDCPTDGSDKIARQYAAQDTRIKLIENTENLRVGESRNKGIDAASGKYIGFCDHDDYVLPDMFERMYRNAEENQSDIVTCDVDYINISNGQTRTLNLPDGCGKSLKEQMHNAALSVSPVFGATVWNMLFKRDFLNKYNLRFGDNRNITSDDLLLLSKVFFFTDKVSHCHTSECPYKHQVGGESTASTYTWLNIPLIINYNIDLYHFLEKRKLTVQQSLHIAEGRIRQCYTGFRKELKFKGRRHALKQARQAAGNEAVHQLLKPLFSTVGCKYALKNLPPTKLIFACLLYLGYFCP